MNCSASCSVVSACIARHPNPVAMDTISRPGRSMPGTPGAFSNSANALRMEYSSIPHHDEHNRKDHVGTLFIPPPTSIEMIRHRWWRPPCARPHGRDLPARHQPQPARPNRCRRWRSRRRNPTVSSAATPACWAIVDVDLVTSTELTGHTALSAAYTSGGVNGELGILGTVCLRASGAGAALSGAAVTASRSFF